MENWQRCRDCGKETYPSILWPLAMEHTKLHDTTRCELCKTLGRDCFISGIEEEEEKRNINVKSEVSAISDLSDHDGTPVNSDEESILVDDLLSSKFNMK